mmetsp:Transcript_28374/g.80097  ORF Transcript_28374/g.80097 Transcript_28374/m.80097 type:complete len:353 (+) Transcript_28374:176-1234(+)
MSQGKQLIASRSSTGSQQCGARRDHSAPQSPCRGAQRRGISGQHGHLLVRSGKLQAGLQKFPPPADRRMIWVHAVEPTASAASAEVQGSTAVQQLNDGLTQIDQYLQPVAQGRGVADEAAAVELVQRMKDAGVTIGFGGARQVPKRVYTLAELRLNNIQTEQLLSPVDKTLNKISDRLTIAAVAGVGTLGYFQHWDSSQLLSVVILYLFGATFDQVAAGGGISALVLDTLGRALSPTYKRRVAAHEAGHFLIAYLLGLLPQAYTLSSLDAYNRYKAFNVQAGTVFCDSTFQQEVATGRLTSGTLDTYTCVALAGVATEYLQFGVAEGGMGDVQQLDGLLRALSFTQVLMTIL